MKAMLTDQEHNLVWSDVEEPQVKADSVLIEVHAAAVNRADILQRQGKYPSPAGCPQWMGLEVAGVVVKTGAAVTRWKVGDRVCALLGGGGYAEYAAVTEKMVMPIPQGLSFEEAASLPEAYATCYLNLFIDGGMKAGETVFFPAGNSGLASVGIPMAKAFGAYVITTVRTAEKKEKITHLGADEIIDTSSEAVGDAIERIAAAGHPVDIAVDCVGGDAIGQCLPYVNTGCRWMLISTMGGNAGTYTDGNRAECRQACADGSLRDHGYRKPDIGIAYVRLRFRCDYGFLNTVQESVMDSSPRALRSGSCGPSPDAHRRQGSPQACESRE